MGKHLDCRMLALLLLLAVGLLIPMGHGALFGQGGAQDPGDEPRPEEGTGEEEYVPPGEGSETEGPREEPGEGSRIEGTLITLDLNEYPVTQTLRYLASNYGFDLVCGKDVGGNISLSLIEVDRLLAFKAILEATGYEAMIIEPNGSIGGVAQVGQLRDSVVIIRTAPDRGPIMEHRIFEVRHQPATADEAWVQSLEFQQLYEQVVALLSGNGRATSSTGVGSIWVEDLPERLEVIERYISQVQTRRDMEGDFPGWTRPGIEEEGEEEMPGGELPWWQQYQQPTRRGEPEEGEEEPVITRELYRLPREIGRLRENLVKLIPSETFTVISEQERLILIEGAQDVHELIAAYLQELEAAIPQDELVLPRARRPVTRVYYLQQPVSTIADAIRPFISDSGTMVVDPEDNSIIIRDFASQMDVIERFILVQDQEPRQVLLESTFLEVKLDSDTSFGLDTLWSRGVGSTNLSYDSPTPTATSGGFAFGITEGTDWQVSIQALQNDNDTNILSRPKFVVANNRSAEITVGQEIPYLASQDTSAGGTGTSSVEFKDVSLNMKATPHIEPGGRIRLTIEIEIKERIGETTIGGDPQPILSNRRASTEVFLDDGDTLIIGGLMEDKQTESVSRIPILGDIPVLGTLFSQSNLTSVKTDLLFIVTPTIIRDRRDQAENTSGISIPVFRPTQLQVPDWYQDDTHSRLRPAR